MPSPKSLEKLREVQILEYANAKRDYGLYLQCAWDILEPTTPLKWNWHHDLICEYLQATATGQIQRLIINIAPRSTKSTLVTVGFPTWLWIADPATRFLFGSHSDTLAVKHSILRRNILESEWYRRGFGHRFKLSADVNTKSEFANNKTGLMKSAGILASITGEGGDYIIIDDPHDPKKAASEAERESAIANFDLAWSTRLNDKKKGRIIVVMQRLHENDLTGHLLEKDLGYTHLKIPTVAEERERLVFPVSGKFIDREEGDLMHPDRDGHKEIDQAKEDLGPYGFSGQHQQAPVPKKGGIFSSEMFEFGSVPEDMDMVWVTADTAYNDKKENDFTVISAWGMKGGQGYLMDCFRRQIKAELVEDEAKRFIPPFQKFGFRGAWIEPKGHGIYLNQALPKSGVMIPSDTDLAEFFKDRRINKVERANNAVPHLSRKKIIINELLDQKETLLKEALTFPKAKHDDFVDTLVDFIKLAYAREYSMFDLV